MALLETLKLMRAISQVTTNKEGIHESKKYARRSSHVDRLCRTRCESATSCCSHFCVQWRRGSRRLPQRRRAHFDHSGIGWKLLWHRQRNVAATGRSWWISVFTYAVRHLHRVVYVRTGAGKQLSEWTRSGSAGGRFGWHAVWRNRPRRNE